MSATGPNAAPGVGGQLGAVTTFVLIPLGAIGAGVLLALLTAAGSEAALTVCIFTMALAWGAGWVAWRTLLGAWLAAKLGRAMLRSGGNEARFRDETVHAMSEIREAGPAGLPFTWVFVPAAAAVGVVGAAALALLTGGEALVTALLLAALSVAMGVGMRRLARAGRLSLPDE